MRVFYLIIIFLLVSLVFIGCSSSKSNETVADDVETVSFTGTIESVDSNTWLVSTSDQVGFDKASVQIAENVAIPFNPLVGQIIHFEILPEIRESYPVQVTAIAVTLTSFESNVPSYVKISPEAAKEIMDSSDDYILVDVRTQEEFDAGHIEGAILLPVNQIEANAFDILPDFNQKILLYCRSGNRSEYAANLLIDLGYTEVLDFGGIIDWPYEIVK